MKSLKKNLLAFKNSAVAPIIKKVVPSKAYNSIRDYLIHDNTIRLYFDNNVFKLDPKTMKTEGLMLVSYWDGVPNFGDVIGPYLISKLSKKPVLNIYSEKIPGLLTVGSVLQSVNREGMIVWGSGLANEPTKETIENLKKYKPHILSVRGKNTAKVLVDHGIEVPDSCFYGDPALVLPRFFDPISDNLDNKISICPHFTHKSFFLKSTKSISDIRIVDVQKDIETVVSLIKSSSVCISSSLHGLIIAQAYNVPWIWLEIDDNKLGFDDFKFHDFFSTIDSSQVSHVKVNLEEAEKIDWEILAKKATLPTKKYDEELILKSLLSYLNITEA